MTAKYITTAYGEPLPSLIGLYTYIFTELQECILRHDLRFCQQLTERIIHTCDTEIRLSGKGAGDEARRLDHFHNPLPDGQGELLPHAQRRPHRVLVQY